MLSVEAPSPPCTLRISKSVCDGAVELRAGERCRAVELYIRRGTKRLRCKSDVERDFVVEFVVEALYSQTAGKAVTQRGRAALMGCLRAYWSSDGRP